MNHKLDRNFLQSDKLRELAEKAKKHGIAVRSPEESQRLYEHTLKHIKPDEDIAVFAYGSLIWNPLAIIDAVESVILLNHQRQFCINLPSFRATPDKPGLMLGLIKKQGANCHGQILWINHKKIDEELPLIWQREMVTTIYQPEWVDVDTSRGKVKALAFIVDKDSPRYLANLTLKDQAKRIAFAEGEMGTNRDYLFDLVDHLVAANQHDEELLTLVKLVKEYLDSSCNE